LLVSTTVLVHPGEIISEDFMKPYGLSMNRLALDLRVPVARIADISRSAAGSPPALRYGWRVISRPPHNFG
jgi:antitoxin HigA-1